MRQIRSVSDFRAVWAADFSLFPDIVQLSAVLSRKMQKDPDVSPESKTFLKAGGSPLALGNTHLITALEEAFLKVTLKAKLPEDREKRVIAALAIAAADLKRLAPSDGGIGGPPDDGGGGAGGLGGESAGPAAENADVLYGILKNEARKRCAVRTGILFFVSNFINVIGALQAKWEDYAGKDAPFVSGLVSPEVYHKAAQDPQFRHNITWNAILMATLGGLTCLRNQATSRTLVATLAGVTSVGGQLLSNGEVSVSQTLLDILFVRFISLNKTSLVFRTAEGYRRSGYAQPLMIEGLLQMVSESVGSYLYPRGQMAANWIEVQATRIYHSRPRENFDTSLRPDIPITTKTLHEFPGKR